MYLLTTCTRQVGEIEFQCHVTRFVISNAGVIRCQLTGNQNGSLKGYMTYSDEQGDQQPGIEEGPIGSNRWKEMFTEGA